MKIKKGTASHKSLMKTMTSKAMPIKIPKGMMRVACSKRMRMEATTAPTAVPIATTPTKLDACVVL
jgi:hypothetical protein